MTERQAARLGVEPLLFESSHSPFLSRPVDFVAALLDALGRPTLRSPNSDRLPNRGCLPAGRS
jgi:hypothetical protein